MMEAHTAVATISSPPPKRVKTSNAPKKKVRKYKSVKIDPTSAEGVLRKNIEDTFPNAPRNDMNAFVNRDGSSEWHMHGPANNLKIVALTSNGSGLAFDEGRQRVVLVPFTLPGDLVNAHIYRTEEFYLEAEVREVLEYSKEHDAQLVNCQYFGKCAGCQYQNTSYLNQLEIKRTVVENAYKYFAPTLKIPQIHPTVASPLQTAYRTKLTPHFDVPKKGLTGPDFPIGFGQKGRKNILDIEDCSIGTPVVSSGIKSERKKARESWQSYKVGATILLRNAVNDRLVTDPREIMQERVGDFIFEFKAGEFFQNNNSILPVVIKFVGEALKIGEEQKTSPDYLVDTYCGCGLFAIACSANAKSVVGVEISAQNVEFARKNAKLNNIKNTEFIVGQAEKIFEKVKGNSDSTSVVIDPPRKGCDHTFLDQLLEFEPAKIVYVSCNVHSQARDLEYFVGRSEGKYVVESLGGFDFFPQTYHVEGVAVLKKVRG